MAVMRAYELYKFGLSERICSNAQDKLQLHTYHQPALLPKGKIIFSFTEVVFLEQTGTYYGTCQKANKLDALGIFIFFLFAWVFLTSVMHKRNAIAETTNGWLVISIAKFTLSAISAEGISGIKWDVIVFTVEQ
ncbi:hypothetical protein ACJX0J_035256 [Zea mays]